MFWPDGLFVHKNANHDVALKIAIVSTDRTVGDRIDAAVGHRKRCDGVNIERAALGFASSWMASVSGYSHVVPRIGPGEFGVIVGTVPRSIPNKRAIAVGFSDFPVDVPKITPARSRSALLIVSAKRSDRRQLGRPMQKNPYAESPSK